MAREFSLLFMSELFYLHIEGKTNVLRLPDRATKKVPFTLHYLQNDQGLVVSVMNTQGPSW